MDNLVLAASGQPRAPIVVWDIIAFVVGPSPEPGDEGVGARLIGSPTRYHVKGKIDGFIFPCRVRGLPDRQ